jgi:hypothetical protein
MALLVQERAKEEILYPHDRPGLPVLVAPAPSLLWPDAGKRLVGTEKDAPIGDGRRRLDGVLEVVAPQHQWTIPQFDDGGSAAVIDGVELAAGDDR